jgi:histidinol-phosphate phosphatase family protein
MKRPAIFFDRDNTLILNDGYLGDPSKVVLAPGAAAAVAKARSLGYATVVISNQSGVARGMFDEDAVHAVNAQMDQMLVAEHPSAVIDRHEFCPYHPEGTVQPFAQESLRRKPKPGMILDAARTLALDLSRSWVIGDAARDVEAGKAAGCKTILVKDSSIAASPAASEEVRQSPDFTASNLGEAIEHIAKNPIEAAPPMEFESHGSGDATRVVAGNRATIGRLAQPIRPATGAGEPGASMPRHPQTSSPRMEAMLDQVLTELRRRREQPEQEFSVSKLLAGIVQVLAVAVMVRALIEQSGHNLIPSLLVSLILQTMTIALLIMSRQR